MDQRPIKNISIKCTNCNSGISFPLKNWQLFIDIPGRKFSAKCPICEHDLTYHINKAIEEAERYNSALHSLKSSSDDIIGYSFD